MVDSQHWICKQQQQQQMSFAESERVRKAIPFEEVQYGQTFTNETFDIYGIDLPKGIFLFIFQIPFDL